MIPPGTRAAVGVGLERQPKNQAEAQKQDATSEDAAPPGRMPRRPMGMRSYHVKDAARKVGRRIEILA